MTAPLQRTRGARPAGALLLVALLTATTTTATAVSGPAGRRPIAPVTSSPTGSAGGADPGANPAGSSGSSAEQDDVERRWHDAVAVAEAARLDYERRERDVETALAALARTFTTSTLADEDSDTAAQHLAEARAARGRLVRGIYAAGGPTGMLAAAVAAPDPDLALWRMSTDRRLMGIALALTSQAQDQAQTELQVRQVRRLAAEQAADRAAALLAEVRADADAADAVLARAVADVDAWGSRLEQLKAAERERQRRLAQELAETRAAAARARQAAVSQVSAIGIPAGYLLDYRGAATTCPGMDWTLLAGVGQVESGHGRNNGPSSAGAIGPMQFMPATFAAYAVDGNADGVTDAWNATDAIYTAAHYLCSSGAGEGPDGVHRALLTYNHAEWYVQLVLAAQASISRRSQDHPEALTP